MKSKNGRKKRIKEGSEGRESNKGSKGGVSEKREGLREHMGGRESEESNEK